MIKEEKSILGSSESQLLPEFSHICNKKQKVGER
jgi:hypothetical protein